MRGLPIYVILLIMVSCNNSNTINQLNKNDSAVRTTKSADVPKSDTAISTKKRDSINKINSANIETDKANTAKAYVSKDDSSISLTGNIRLDYRIFGYEKPDTSSKKQILFSVFTDDVEGNPFNCTYGAYYQTSDMNDMEIKYISTDGQFVKANILKGRGPQAIIFIDKRWIEFE